MQNIGVRRILVVAKNIRGPIKQKWVGGVMYVNYDFGVSTLEAARSATRQLFGPERIV
jgi:hypothetical protein